MRSWVILVSLVVALPSLAAGQSLGDAAKRERERREKLRQGGAGARTITEDDLAANKGTLANDPKQAPAADEAGEGKKKADKASAGEPRASGAADDNAAKTEDYWRGRATAARGRVAKAQARADAFERMIRFGQPAEYDENGRRVIYSLQQMKAMADAAQAELAVAQQALEDLLEEGRRAGAQPGWLR